MGRNRNRGHRERKKQRLKAKKATPIAPPERLRAVGGKPVAKVKHYPKKARPEQVRKLATAYFGGSYYCVGDGKE